MNLEGLHEHDEDNNESSLVLKHIEDALVNDHNIIYLSIDLMKQYETLLESFEMRENGFLIEDLGMRENGKLAEIRANSELVKIREWKEGPLVKKKVLVVKQRKYESFYAKTSVIENVFYTNNPM